MPFELTWKRTLLQGWAESITGGSLHTGPPGKSGNNYWQGFSFDRVRATQDSVIGTVSEFSRMPTKFGVDPEIVTHIAFWAGNDVILSRVIGSIRLGNHDSIILPTQITILRLRETG